MKHDNPKERINEIEKMIENNKIYNNISIFISDYAKNNPDFHDDLAYGLTYYYKFLKELYEKAYNEGIANGHKL